MPQLHSRYLAIESLQLMRHDSRADQATVICTLALPRRLARSAHVHQLTSNVKQRQGHIMFEEEQRIPEQIEDKLECP